MLLLQFKCSISINFFFATFFTLSRTRFLFSVLYIVCLKVVTKWEFKQNLKLDIHEKKVIKIIKFKLRKKEKNIEKFKKKKRIIVVEYKYSFSRKFKEEEIGILFYYSFSMIWFQQYFCLITFLFFFLQIVDRRNKVFQQVFLCILRIDDLKF